jgi:HSP20 family protein
METTSAGRRSFIVKTAGGGPFSSERREHTMVGTNAWRWGVADSLSEMQRLQREVNRLFVGARQEQGFDYPPLNLLIGEEDAIVMMEVPGLEAEKTDISVINEVLTISGMRVAETLAAGETYHRQERPAGRFTRTLQLPFKVNAGNVTAQYQKGILSIKLPRAEEEKPHRIAVNVQ